MDEVVAQLGWVVGVLVRCKPDQVLKRIHSNFCTWQGLPGRGRSWRDQLQWEERRDGGRTCIRWSAEGCQCTPEHTSCSSCSESPLRRWKSGTWKLEQKLGNNFGVLVNLLHAWISDRNQTPQLGTKREIKARSRTIEKFYVVCGSKSIGVGCVRGRWVVLSIRQRKQWKKNLGSDPP